MFDSLRDSLEVTIASDPRLAADRYAALVALCRLLADQVDRAGDAASTHLTAAYLSALKDIQRALPEGTKEPVGQSTLGRLRAVHAGKPAS